PIKKYEIPGKIKLLSTSDGLPTEENHEIMDGKVYLIKAGAYDSNDST
ncbi:3740_t:CDS:2, partial [Rhizophagus irregularis]